MTLQQEVDLYRSWGSVKRNQFQQVSGLALSSVLGCGEYQHVPVTRGAFKSPEPPAAPQASPIKISGVHPYGV